MEKLKVGAEGEENSLKLARQTDKLITIREMILSYDQWDDEGGVVSGLCGILDDIIVHLGAIEEEVGKLEAEKRVGG